MRAEIAETTIRERDFHDFYRRWFPAVTRAISLVVHDVDLGQDIAQDAFGKVWQRWEAMESPDHARNFVFRAALNEARSHLRRRRPLRLLGLDRPERGVVADPTAVSADRVTVFRALRSLSRRQRECVVLVDYLGYDATAAGRVLGIRPSTVRVQVMRGRTRLRRALEDEP